MISYAFPPDNRPGARRSMQVSQTLASAGEAVYVVTAQEAPRATEVVSEVYHVSAYDVRKVSGVGRAPLKQETRKLKWTAWILKLRQAYPFVYLTDNGGPHYRQKAYQIATGLIKEHGITTLFSSFRPWSDHLVARRLKRTYPELHWIADFRDLPVDPVRRDVWFPALQTWWGKRVVRSADEVWCVSEGQREQLVGWHPNIKVVRNALLALPPGRSAPRSAHFTIVYTGSLYARLQTVQPLVEALRRLIATGEVDPALLRLVYYGKDGNLFCEWTRELPPGCVTTHLPVAPASAQKIQREAQLLLLLNWSAPDYYGVLTAKLWDYLASGRPILALVNGPGDEELKGIVEGAGAGAVLAVTEQRQLTAWLRELYARWSIDQSLPWSVNRQALAQHLNP